MCSESLCELGFTLTSRNVSQPQDHGKSFIPAQEIAPLTSVFIVFAGLTIYKYNMCLTAGQDKMDQLDALKKYDPASYTRLHACLSCVLTALKHAVRRLFFYGLPFVSNLCVFLCRNSVSELKELCRAKGVSVGGM